MSQSLTELKAQIAALQNQVAEIKKAETADAISKCRAIINEFELTAADLFSEGRGKVAVRKTGKVAPKYRDPATGVTWTGRGLAPKWMAGKNKEDFLIATAA